MMAIKYNPYGWEIRPYVSESEKCRKRRDDAIKRVHSLIQHDIRDEQYVTRLLCDALSAHEEMMLTEPDTIIGTQMNLRYFDEKVDELYELRRQPFHSQFI